MIFVIGEEQRAQLRAMKEFARAHPISLEELHRLAARDPALDPVHRHPEECYVKLPVGFEVGLTYELQQQPCWHLSMSAELPGRYPRPEAVTLVLEALGLPELKERVACKVYGEVVNIWFLADGEYEGLKHAEGQEPTEGRVEK
jgi:hypothetical protein